mmetsp:Transcript_54287/g.144637  ORF Transcript_54287/g.144637 Transcript_54287/m.144637 type:complete len:218 (-) Transcript_54287:325-978(-)
MPARRRTASPPARSCPAAAAPPGAPGAGPSAAAPGSTPASRPGSGCAGWGRGPWRPHRPAARPAASRRQAARAGAHRAVWRSPECWCAACRRGPAATMPPAARPARSGRLHHGAAVRRLSPWRLVRRRDAAGPQTNTAGSSSAAQTATFQALAARCRPPPGGPEPSKGLLFAPCQPRKSRPRRRKRPACPAESGPTPQRPRGQEPAAWGMAEPGHHH